MNQLLQKPNSDLYYQSIFNQSGLALIELDRDTRVICMNNTAIEWFHCTPCDIKFDFLQENNPFKIEGLSAGDLTALKNGTSIQDRKLLVSFEELPFFFIEATLLPIRVGNDINRILFLGKNKTFHELYNLQHLIDQIPGNIYAKDISGRIIACNQYMATYFGLNSPDEIIGKTDLELPWKKKASQIRANDLTVIKTGLGISQEEHIELPNGKKLFVLSSKLPLRNEHGKIVGIIGSSIDITDKKNAEIRENQAIQIVADAEEKIKTGDFIQQIINQAQGSIYAKDNNGRIIVCNDYAAKLLGLNSPADLIGKTDLELPWRKKAAQIIKNDLEVITTGKTLSIEEVIEMPNNDKIIVISTKTPLRNNEGEILGVIGTSLDVTELRKTEAREKEIQIKSKEIETLREKVKMLEILGASIAHEIRNPLLSIRTAAKAIDRYFPKLLDVYRQAKNDGWDLDDIPNTHLTALSKSLDNIEKEVNSSNLFIDILLSKIRMEVDARDIQTLSMKSIIEESLNRYPFRSEHQHSLVHFESEHDFSFNGNATLMSHVLFNLLKNALFYIEQAGKGEIYIWTKAEPTAFFLYFKDTGTGIPADNIPYLFTRFFSRAKNGTGLGLSFCKMVMESIGGDIYCESVEGEYTKFIMRFPQQEIRG